MAAHSMLEKAVYHSLVPTFPVWWRFMKALWKLYESAVAFSKLMQTCEATQKTIRNFIKLINHFGAKQNKESYTWLTIATGF